MSVPSVLFEYATLRRRPHRTTEDLHKVYQAGGGSGHAAKLPMRIAPSTPLRRISLRCYRPK